MWCQDHVRTLQPGVNEWLIFVNVESGASDFLIFESGDQSSFIDNRSARRIDQESVRFHAEKFGGVE